MPNLVGDVSSAARILPDLNGEKLFIRKGKGACLEDADGRRYIDTTELLRVYGAFDPPSQSVIPKMSHGVIVPDDLGEIIAKAVAKAVAEAVEPLRQEIEKLRLENTEQRLIEHKPSIPPVGDHPQFDGAAKDKPQSFADLLAGMD